MTSSITVCLENRYIPPPPPPLTHWARCSTTPARQAVAAKCSVLQRCPTWPSVNANKDAVVGKIAEAVSAKNVRCKCKQAWLDRIQAWLGLITAGPFFCLAHQK